MSSATEVRTADAKLERCPRCDTPRIPGDRYCEVDGHDFEGHGNGERTWCAVVAPDRAYFDRISPDELQFPEEPMTFTYELEAQSVSVGRRSPSRHVFPDIDLGGTYEDPGVSRRHLRFDRSDDGTYSVVDCGSANGTTVNGGMRRITPDTHVPLSEGDRVHLGAWTTITIVCRHPLTR